MRGEKSGREGRFAPIMSVCAGNSSRVCVCVDVCVCACMQAFLYTYVCIAHERMCTSSVCVWLDWCFEAWRVRECRCAAGSEFLWL